MRTHRFALGLGLALASAAPLIAQDPRELPLRRPEVRVHAGTYVPLGAMRADFSAAPMTGIEGAIELAPGVHAVGTFTWTDGRTKVGYAADHANVWQYDVGFELNARRALGPAWLLRPFVGAGGGGRTYDYAEAGALSRTCTAGYGALGTELQRGPLALRAEGRAYVVCFTTPRGGRNVTRQDAGLTLGVAYHLP